jgi:hypothetical protein
MIPHYDLKEFLSILAVVSGDEAIELISRWQSNACVISGFKLEDIEAMKDN